MEDRKTSDELRFKKRRKKKANGIQSTGKPGLPSYS
jgi:hypothetical protein